MSISAKKTNSKADKKEANGGGGAAAAADTYHGLSPETLVATYRTMYMSRRIDDRRSSSGAEQDLLQISGATTRLFCWFSPAMKRHTIGSFRITRPADAGLE